MEHRRRNRTVVPGTVAALLVAVSACSSSSPRPPDGDLIAAARQDEWAGGMVSNGDAEASCGEYVLAVGQPLPDEVADCLRAGATPDASVPAEAAWVSMTSEGDPLVTFAFTGSYVQGLSLSTFTGWDRHGGRRVGVDDALVRRSGRRARDRSVRAARRGLSGRG